jgi:hypothetical protein
MPGDAGVYCVKVVGACNAMAMDCTTITVTNCPGVSPIVVTSIKLMPNGAVHLGISGQINQTYNIEGTADLQTWRVVATMVNIDNTFEFFDPQRGPLCFYRVVMMPSP